MIFPDSYFHAEYRMDFYIPEMMKHAWAAKLELLSVITSICKRHYIEYFACGGTLLGAIRHQGFIPWDDDIDIALKRPDYNRLIRLLPTELPHGFALGGMYADRPRNFMPSEQTVVITDALQWDLAEFYQYFHGFPYRQIGIDLFPFDYIPEDSELVHIQSVLIQNIIVLIRDWNSLKAASLLEDKISEIEQLCNVALTRDNDLSLQKQLLRLSDSLCSLYSENECSLLDNYPAMIARNTSILKKEWYHHIIEVPFENTTIAVPENYHEVLSVCFGSDYMTPRQISSTHHYPFYASQEKAFQECLLEKGYTGTIDDYCKKYLASK